MLTIALASAAPRFVYEEPFTLELGAEIAGPHGLHARYDGLGPVLVGAAGPVMLPLLELSTRDAPFSPGWPLLYTAGLPDGTLGRWWYPGLEVTAISVQPDPYPAQFVVSRTAAHRHTFAWDVPFRAEPGELWRAPDGAIELVQTGAPGGEAVAAELSARRGDELSGVTVPAGRVVASGDLLFAAEIPVGADRVWLRVWRPGETIRPFVPGQPVRLWAGERAGGGGVVVEVSPLGNMWFGDGRAEQIFGTVTVTRGGRSEGGTVTTAEPTLSLFDGAVQVTVGNLSGARFDVGEPVELRVDLR